MLFVGSTLGAVLADTDNGTKFGGHSLTSYEELSEDEARETGARYLDQGISAVSSDGESSFCADAGLSG